MGHLRSPQADSDLGDIWVYVAKRSGSLDTADRLIDSITDRFALLATHILNSALDSLAGCAGHLEPLR